MFRIFKPKYVFKRNFFSELYKNVFLYKSYKKFFSNNVVHIEKRVGTGKGGIMLSEIVNLKKDSFPLFLKIDIEGSELKLLNCLLSNYFKVIQIELINYNDIKFNIEFIVAYLNFLIFIILKLIKSQI